MPAYKFFDGTNWIELLKSTDIPDWAKASSKPSYDDTYVKFSASQSLTTAQKTQARSNIGAGTSSLSLGTSATTAAKGNHTHTLSIVSGGSFPTVLAANTAYTLTAGGSTVVFQTPEGGSSSLYKHDIIINASNFKVCFTLYSSISTAFDATQALQLLYNKKPVLNTSNKISAYLKSSVMLNVVTTEWTESYFWPRHNVTSVTYSGTSISSVTLAYCEFGIKGSGTNSLLTISPASVQLNISSGSITDTVTEC